MTVINDTCESAATLLPNTPFAGSNAGTATNLATADGSGADVWFKFTPSAPGPYGFSLCGSPLDTTLHVYTGSCGNLVEGSYNDDSTYCDLQSAVQVLLQADTPLFSACGRIWRRNRRLYPAGRALFSPGDPCLNSPVADGGFEGGSSSSAWGEYSLAYGSPLWNAPDMAYEGAWLVWFGG